MYYLILQLMSVSLLEILSQVSCLLWEPLLTAEDVRNYSDVGINEACHYLHQKQH